MKRWDRLAYRPGNSETPPVRSADLAREGEERKLILFVRDQALVESLRKTLLRKNIWCAPCPRFVSLVPMIRALEASSVLLDMDDERLDPYAAMAQVEAFDPSVTRIGLTRSLRLRGQLEKVLDRVLLKPLDIGELILAVPAAAPSRSEGDREDSGAVPWFA